MAYYIDSEYMIHTEYKEGYRQVNAEQYFANICNKSAEYYRFVPRGEEWKGGTTANDFIQCVDSNKADMYQREYDAEKRGWTQGYDQSTLDELESEVI